MTTNITNKLNDPANALSAPLCFVAKSSPSNKNGIQPNPNENPIMNTMRLVSGIYLQVFYKFNSQSNNVNANFKLKS